MRRTQTKLMGVGILICAAACSGTYEDDSTSSAPSSAQDSGLDPNESAAEAERDAESDRATVVDGADGAAADGAAADGAAADGADAPGTDGIAALEVTSSAAAFLGGLKDWHLTLPTGKSNKADSLEQPELGKKDVPGYFELAPTQDRVVMTSLFGGARTSKGTAYARTELRERYTGSDALENMGWKCKESKRSMRVRQRITLSPTRKPEMVVGQIHDDDNDLLEVRYIGPENSKGVGTGNGKTDTGRIEALFNGESVKRLDAAYQIGQEMVVIISTDGQGKMYVDYENRATGVASKAEGKFDKPKLGCFFKAGNYHQACSVKDINGNSNEKCKKSKNKDRWETDPQGKSVLEVFEVSLQ